MRASEIVVGADRNLQVLCLGAHADDIEIGCGGALLRIAQRYPGVVIHWVVLSARGPRADEARAGAARFRPTGIPAETLIENFRDGYFPFDGAPIKDLFEGLKSRFSPDLIFTHYRDDRHQDHRVVSDLAWNTWRDHLILEYEVPKWDGDLGTPNAFIPLSGKIADQKANAIVETFVSQRSKPWFSTDTFTALMKVRGNECRAEEGFAEAFHARKLILL